jgi:hypothetical protein
VDDVFADLNNGPDERRLADSYTLLSAQRLSPMPLYLGVRMYAPVSPATITLSLPIALPLVVNGRLVGICMLGITSCGKPEAPSCVSNGSSSSPLEATAWLVVSSMANSSSDSLSEVVEGDLGVLDNTAVGCGDGASRLSGAKVMGEPWLEGPLENTLFSCRTGVVLVPSGSVTEPVNELFDSDLELLAPCFFVLIAFCGPLPLPALAPSEPNADSSVSWRLCTPNVLSRCLAAVSVPGERAIPKSSIRRITKEVGIDPALAAA